MNQNIWIELEQTIEDQLKLQVDLSLERHHNFHPQIQFHGIDNKPQGVGDAL
jgi:hypothetical protein